MIDKVIKRKSCTYCGTCISICPKNAISCQPKNEDQKIIVDFNKCNKCGLCLEVCSGLEVNFEKINADLFKKVKKIKFDPNLGYLKNCYLGFSYNKDLRTKCSSGGVVTSILIYLLKYKIVDGALVTSMDQNNPLLSKPFIAYNKKQIVEARGSKYTPVVLNQCLKEIIESKKKKFAVVGLPCHIHGIRKFQKTNPILKKKIVVCLGLMCGQGVNVSGTSFILKQLKIKANEVKKIQYRGDGWPGDITVTTKNNGFKRLPYLDTFKTFTMGFFTPERCFLCNDLTNELADISFGDAWIPKLIDTKKGTNFIISRSEIGQKILTLSKQFLSYKLIEPSLLMESKKIRLFWKKDSHELLTKTARLMGLGTFNNHSSTKSRISFLSIFVIISYLNAIISNKYSTIFLKIPFCIWKLPLQIYRKTLSIYKRFTIKVTFLS